MKLKKIDLINFRCFEEAGFTFGEKQTVIIGKNGTGKSSLLSAIRKGLSFIFTDNKNEVNPLKRNNNATVSRLMLLDTRYDEVEGFSWPTVISYETAFNHDNLSWAFFKQGHPGGLKSTAYREARTKYMEYITQEEAEWPLIAFFGDSYPHIGMNLGRKSSKVIKSDELPRDFAYYGWDEYLNCNTIWFERFKYIDNYTFDAKRRIDDLNQRISDIESGNRKFENSADNEVRLNDLKNRRNSLAHNYEERCDSFNTEKRYIEDRLVNFTMPLSSDYNFINSEFEIININSSKVSFEKNQSIKIDFKSGIGMYLEMLPMGYKRLLHIVFDLAYRSYILTKGRYEPTGVVIIDEVELHLHPTLQQEVIQRFKSTFPEIQFIYSTHSPLVISNLKVDDINAKIIKLNVEEDSYTHQYVDNIYGMDYTTGLTEVMGAKFRKSEIDRQIDSIVILRTYGKDKEADELQKELDELVGANNSSIKNEIENRVSYNKRKA